MREPIAHRPTTIYEYILYFTLIFYENRAFMKQHLPTRAKSLFTCAQLSSKLLYFAKKVPGQQKCWHIGRLQVKRQCWSNICGSRRILCRTSTKISLNWLMLTNQLAGYSFLAHVSEMGILKASLHINCNLICRRLLYICGPTVGR